MKPYILITWLFIFLAAALPAMAEEPVKQSDAGEKAVPAEAAAAAESGKTGKESAVEVAGSTGSDQSDDPRSKQLASILAAANASDREGRIDSLFEALEVSPADAGVILKHLSRNFVPGSAAAALLPRYDALWQKYPDSLPIAICGGGLHAMAGESAEACRLLAATLKTITPEKMAEDPGKVLMLLENYLFHLDRCNDFATGKKVIDSALVQYKEAAARGELLQAAAEFYRTAALRTEGFRLPADDWINSERPWRRAYAETLFELRKTDPRPDESNVSERLAFYLSHKRSDFALALASEIAEKSPSLRNRIQYFQVAVESGDIVIAEKILDSLLKGAGLSDTAVDLARIETRINAGDYAGAEELLAKNAARPEYRAMGLQLLLKSGNFKKLLESANAAYQAGDRSESVAMQLLIAAERLGDREALKRARSILDASAAEKHDTANSVGYICAVLNVDLDHAERLLNFALQESPLNAAYLDSMAFLKFRQGKLEEADKLIHKALSLVTPATGAGVIIEHAGDIALARGRREEALSRYNYALSLAAEDSNLDVAALKAKMAKLTEKK